MIDLKLTNTVPRENAEKEKLQVLHKKYIVVTVDWNAVINDSQKVQEKQYNGTIGDVIDFIKNTDEEVIYIKRAK